MGRALIMAWGILGVLGLLAQAVARLAPFALEAIGSGLQTWHWAILVVWVAFMAHAEGYRGFHRRFSPRVVARARALAQRPPTWTVVLAPFFCMSLFGASRRGQIVARSVTAGIVGLIILVRRLAQPWRGIVDAGVVVGLAIGMLSILYYLAASSRGVPLPIGPDLPPPVPEDEG